MWKAERENGVGLIDGTNDCLEVDDGEADGTTRESRAARPLPDRKDTEPARRCVRQGGETKSAKPQLVSKI